MREGGGEKRTLPGGADRESLEAAVATSRSWRGVLRQFGLTSPRAGRILRSACDAWEIDYSHFSSRTWTDEDLSRALATATSWPEVASALGYAVDSGSARATVRKHAARLGLDPSSLGSARGPHAAAPLAGTTDLLRLREAGTYLVAAACALSGYRISWPLEPAIYDLLVDNGHIQRVQVKTTTWRPNGKWACKITHSSQGQKAWYTDEEIDYFGVVDGQLRVHLIPVKALDGLGTILVDAYAAYRVGWPPESFGDDRAKP